MPYAAEPGVYWVGDKPNRNGRCPVAESQASPLHANRLVVAFCIAFAAGVPNPPAGNAGWGAFDEQAEPPTRVRTGAWG